MIKELTVSYFDENDYYPVRKVKGDVKAEFKSELGLEIVIFESKYGTQLLYLNGEYKPLTDEEFNPTVEECMNFLNEEYPNGIPNDIVDCIKKYFK